MRPSIAFRSRGRSSSAGFTLVEIILAIGIIATALVAILGMLPAGMSASRDATNHTVVAAVLEDLHHRLEGTALKLGPAEFSPAYYDDLGVYIPWDAPAEVQARKVYRADLEILKWKDRPDNTSSLQPVSVRLSWPVNLGTGEAIGKDNPRTVVTYTVTTLTGPDWQAIDPDYVQKVEY